MIGHRTGIFWVFRGNGPVLWLWVAFDAKYAGSRKSLIEGTKDYPLHERVLLRGVEAANAPPSFLNPFQLLAKQLGDKERGGFHSFTGILHLRTCRTGGSQLAKEKFPFLYRNSSSSDIYVQ